MQSKFTAASRGCPWDSMTFLYIRGKTRTCVGLRFYDSRRWRWWWWQRLWCREHQQRLLGQLLQLLKHRHTMFCQINKSINQSVILISGTISKPTQASRGPKTSGKAPFPFYPIFSSFPLFSLHFPSLLSTSLLPVVLLPLPSLRCRISTWMGDRPWAGKPSRYVTSHLGQLSLPSLRGR